MDHLQDASMIILHLDIDQLIPAEPESVIDDLPSFGLTSEDTTSIQVELEFPPIQVELEFPPIQVILDLPPKQKNLVCTGHPCDCYRNTGHGHV